MDPLMQFFTWQFMLFSLGIAGATFVARLVIEYYKIDAHHKDFWKNLVLPIFPLVMGCLMGWGLKMYPYPDGLNGTSAHILFGLVAGMFSGLAYRVIKSLLTSKLTPGGSSDMFDEVVPVAPTAPVVVSPTSTTVTTTVTVNPDVVDKGITDSANTPNNKQP